jgi:hypothetical protein
LQQGTRKIRQLRRATLTPCDNNATWLSLNPWLSTKISTKWVRVWSRRSQSQRGSPVQIAEQAGWWAGWHAAQGDALKDKIKLIEDIQPLLVELVGRRAAANADDGRVQQILDGMRRLYEAPPPAPEPRRGERRTDARVKLTGAAIAWMSENSRPETRADLKRELSDLCPILGVKPSEPTLDRAAKDALAAYDHWAALQSPET